MEIPHPVQPQKKWCECEKNARCESSVSQETDNPCDTGQKFCAGSKPVRLRDGEGL